MEFALGDPLIGEVAVLNGGVSPATIIRMDAEIDFQFVVCDASGKTIQPKTGITIGAPTNNYRVTIRAGSIINESFNLSDLYDLKRGSYRVSATRPVTSSADSSAFNNPFHVSETLKTQSVVIRIK